MNTRPSIILFSSQHRLKVSLLHFLVDHRIEIIINPVTSVHLTSHDKII
uniref:Uncharacterized protein n=1 Tax=Arundo donax TaxID=35708 RepID=A0A0A9DQ82_ARUDO